jgi:hypothetical protein
MKDSEAVTAAQDLIRDPESWITGAWCVPRGTGEGWGNMDKDRYCLEGAIGRALGMYGRKFGEPAKDNKLYAAMQAQRARISRELLRLIPAIEPTYTYPGVANFNDSSFVYHEDVMALLDKARAKFEEEGH